jgi:hypothetical protein
MLNSCKNSLLYDRLAEPLSDTRLCTSRCEGRVQANVNQHASGCFLHANLRSVLMTGFYTYPEHIPSRTSGPLPTHHGQSRNLASDLMIENPLRSYSRPWIAWASSPSLARSPVGPPPGPIVKDQEQDVLMHRSGRASRLRAHPRSRCETRSSTSPEIRSPCRLGSALVPL